MITLRFTSVTKDSPGAGQFTVVGTYSDETLPLPSQRQTSEDGSLANPNWARNIVATNDAVLLSRNGVASVAFGADALAKAALVFNPSLTHAPYFSATTAGQSVAATGSAFASFAASVVSELTATYSWSVSTDGGSTFGSALTDTGPYLNSATATLKVTPTAPATLTWDNSAGPSDGDTVTLGSTTYTFKTALTPTAGQVLLNGGGDAALLNLIRAVNHTGTPGTDYANLGSTAAANTQFTADAAVASHAAKFRETAGGTYATTETSAQLSFAATTHVSLTGYYYRCTATNAIGSTVGVASLLSVT